VRTNEEESKRLSRTFGEVSSMMSNAEMASVPLKTMRDKETRRQSRLFEYAQLLVEDKEKWGLV
jgi:hypothetical protein